MKRDTKPGTQLCYTDVDQILVRGADLCAELIGKMTFTEMMLFHLSGRRPTAAQVAVVDAVLVTIMEHGMTPSAISARQTLFGAPEALQGAVAAGILGVGSRFAGTSGDCAALLVEIVAAPDDERKSVAAAIVQRFRAERRPVPGYGHPVHTSGDPRVARLEEVAAEQGLKGDYVAAMHLLRDAIEEVTGRSLVINASAAMGAVMAEVDIPPRIMRGLVIVSRAAGIVGHLLEEMDRPASQTVWDLAEEHVPYDGPRS